MRAWVVAVGSEMLTPSRVDTNSLVITERLNAIGCHVCFKAVVADDVDEVSSILGRGIGSADVLICTGGLGPTEDDITRDGLARLLDVPLDVAPAILEGIEARFARRGLVMSPINRRYTRSSTCRYARRAMRSSAPTSSDCSPKSVAR